MFLSALLHTLTGDFTHTCVCVIWRLCVAVWWGVCYMLGSLHARKHAQLKKSSRDLRVDPLGSEVPAAESHRSHTGAL